MCCNRDATFNFSNMNAQLKLRSLFIRVYSIHKLFKIHFSNCLHFHILNQIWSLSYILNIQQVPHRLQRILPIFLYIPLAIAFPQTFPVINIKSLVGASLRHHSRLVVSTLYRLCKMSYRFFPIFKQRQTLWSHCCIVKIPD